MVWPEVEVVAQGDGEDIILPRIRSYVHFRKKYEVIIQPHNRNHTIPLMKISKQIYQRFDNVDLFFISKRKLRVIAESKDDANKLASDSDLREQYRVFIPPENCEVKAVIEIPSDVEFTEEYIYRNTAVKQFAEYGFIPVYTKITEVKRFSKPNPENKDERINMDLVMMSFAGDVLPSHVVMDRIIFPVKPFIERVIQCKKCWRYGHSEKICRRSNMICSRCGTSHQGICSSMPHCVNCHKFHDAKYNSCETRIKLNQQAKEKANEKAPKPKDQLPQQIMRDNVFNIDPREFPPVDNKRRRKTPKNRNVNVENAETINNTQNVTDDDQMMEHESNLKTQPTITEIIDLPTIPIQEIIENTVSLETNETPLEMETNQTPNIINNTQLSQDHIIQNTLTHFEAFQQSVQKSQLININDDDENITD